MAHVDCMREACAKGMDAAVGTKDSQLRQLAIDQIAGPVRLPFAWNPQLGLREPATLVAKEVLQASALALRVHNVRMDVNDAVAVRMYALLRKSLRDRRL